MFVLFLFWFLFSSACKRLNSKFVLQASRGAALPPVRLEAQVNSLYFRFYRTEGLSGLYAIIDSR